MNATVPLWRRIASAIGKVADQMPAREKTSSERRAHLAEIDKIVERWQSGEISTAEKRELIAKENAFWYGKAKRSSSTGEMLTSANGDVSHVTPPEHPPAPDDDEHEEPWWQK